MEKKPTLQQVDSLIRMLRGDQGIINHWVLNEETWKIFSQMSLERYNYIIALIFNKKRSKLNQLFEEMGIERQNPDLKSVDGRF